MWWLETSITWSICIRLKCFLHRLKALDVSFQTVQKSFQTDTYRPSYGIFESRPFLWPDKDEVPWVNLGLSADILLGTKRVVLFHFIFLNCHFFPPCRRLVFFDPQTSLNWHAEALRSVQSTVLDSNYCETTEIWYSSLGNNKSHVPVGNQKRIAENAKMALSGYRRSIARLFSSLWEVSKVHDTVSKIKTEKYVPTILPGH